MNITLKLNVNRKESNTKSMLTEPKSNGSPEASSTMPLPPPRVATAAPLEPAAVPAVAGPEPPEAPAAVLPVVLAAAVPVVRADLAAALATKFRWMLDSIGAGGVGERDDKAPEDATADGPPSPPLPPPPIAAASKLTRLWLSGRFR